MIFSRRIRRGAISILLILSMLTSLSLSVFAESESASETEKDDSTIEVVVLINDVAPGKKIKSTDVEVKTFKNVNIPSNVISNINKIGRAHV